MEWVVSLQIRPANARNVTFPKIKIVSRIVYSVPLSSVCSVLYVCLGFVFRLWHIKQDQLNQGWGFCFIVTVLFANRIWQLAVERLSSLLELVFLYTLKIKTKWNKQTEPSQLLAPREGIFFLNSLVDIWLNIVKLCTVVLFSFIYCF